MDSSIKTFSLSHSGEELDLHKCSSSSLKNCFNDKLNSYYAAEFSVNSLKAVDYSDNSYSDSSFASKDNVSSLKKDTPKYFLDNSSTSLITKGIMNEVKLNLSGIDNVLDGTTSMNFGLSYSTPNTEIEDSCLITRKEYISVSWSELRLHSFPQEPSRPLKLSGDISLRDNKRWSCAKSIRLRDENGTEGVIFFYVADPTPYFSYDQLMPGTRIEITNPKYHIFLDKQEGLRIDLASSIKVLGGTLTDDKRVAYGQLHKKTGNQYLFAKEFERAIEFYEYGIDFVRGSFKTLRNLEKEGRSIAAACYLNIAKSLLLQERWKEVESPCLMALGFNISLEYNAKAHYRLSQAYWKLGEFNHCRERLRRAMELCPRDEHIYALFSRLRVEILDRNKGQRDLFGSSNNGLRKRLAIKPFGYRKGLFDTEEEDFPQGNKRSMTTVSDFLISQPHDSITQSKTDDISKDTSIECKTSSKSQEEYGYVANLNPPKPIVSPAMKRLCHHRGSASTATPFFLSSALSAWSTNTTRSERTGSPSSKNLVSPTKTGNDMFPTTRVTHLQSIPSFHDIGGWRTLDGRFTIRKHWLYASGLFDTISKSDLRCLQSKYGVKTLIDLRSDVERRIDCAIFPKLRNFQDDTTVHLNRYHAREVNSDASKECNMSLYANYRDLFTPIKVCLNWQKKKFLFWNRSSFLNSDSSVDSSIPIVSFNFQGASLTGRFESYFSNITTNDKSFGLLLKRLKNFFSTSKPHNSVPHYNSLSHSSITRSCDTTKSDITNSRKLSSQQLPPDISSGRLLLYVDLASHTLKLHLWFWVWFLCVLLSWICWFSPSLGALISTPVQQYGISRKFKDSSDFIRLYIGILQCSASEIRFIIEYLSDESNYPIVIFSGNDYNVINIFLAILLSLLGISDEDIIRESFSGFHDMKYANFSQETNSLSLLTKFNPYDPLNPFYSEKISTYSDITCQHETLEEKTTQRRHEYIMSGFLRYLKLNYGGSEAYLKHIGVSSEVMHRICKILLIPL